MQFLPVYTIPFSYHIGFGFPIRYAISPCLHDTVFISYRIRFPNPICNFSLFTRCRFLLISDSVSKSDMQFLPVYTMPFSFDIGFGFQIRYAISPCLHDTVFISYRIRFPNPICNFSLFTRCRFLLISDSVSKSDMQFLPVYTMPFSFDIGFGFQIRYAISPCLHDTVFISYRIRFPNPICNFSLFTRCRFLLISDSVSKSDMQFLPVYTIPFSYHIGFGFPIRYAISPCLHDTVFISYRIRFPNPICNFSLFTRCRFLLISDSVSKSDMQFLPVYTMPFSFDIGFGFQIRYAISPRLHDTVFI